MSRSFTLALAIATWSLANSLTDADAQAQTVQLPTMQTFSSTGSVLVPDRGGAFLGGVNRAASGYSRRGVPLFGAGSPTPIGRQVSATQTSVHATIIDLNEWDQQMRRQASGQAGSQIGADRSAALTGRGVGGGGFSPISPRGQQQSFGSIFDQHAYGQSESQATRSRMSFPR